MNNNIGINDCDTGKKIDIYEAICTLQNKVNELVIEYNRIDKDHTEIEARLQILEDYIKYLLGEGLAIEVSVVLEKWLADGTLADIINETIFKELKDAIELNTSRIDDLQISIKDCGAIPGDKAIDNTPFIQCAIDQISLRGGGTVFIPNGIWYCKGTLDLKGGVRLLGVANRGANKPLTGVGSRLSYIGTSPNFITAIRQENELYYRFNVSIENLFIVGENNKCVNGILLTECAYTRFKNVMVQYFNIGIKIVDGMLDTYREIAISACLEYSVYYTKEKSSITTQYWYNCYFGQNTAPTFVTCIKTTDSCINSLTVTDCTFESTPSAMHLGTNVRFQLNNTYTENVPNVANGTAFKFAKEVEEYSWVTDINVNGGIYMGSINHYPSSTLFDIGASNVVSFNDISYRRWGKTLQVDDFASVQHRGKIIFNGCSGETGLVDLDIDDIMYRGKIVVNNCYANGKMIGATSLIKLNTPHWLPQDGYQNLTLIQNTNTNVMNLYGSIKKTESSTTTIGTLPKEARPPMFVISAVYGLSSNGSIEYAGSCSINPLTGNIVVLANLNSFITLIFNSTYSTVSPIDQTYSTREIKAPYKLPEIFNHKPYYLK